MAQNPVDLIPRTGQGPAPRSPAQESAMAAEAARATLGPEDLKIFSQLYARCADGTLTSALGLAFDLNNFNLALQKPFLQDEVAVLRASPGFWQALNICYGYRYGQFNRGHLIKQLIDAGHLSSEVTGTFAAVLMLITGTRLTVQAYRVFPLTARALTAAGMALPAGILLHQILELSPLPITDAERQNLRELKQNLFAEPDRAVAQARALGLRELARREAELQDPGLSPESRAEKDARYLKLKKALADLDETLK